LFFKRFSNVEFYLLKIIFLSLWSLSRYMTKLYFSVLLFISLGANVLAQEEVVLYQQFNGKYSFTFIGNTLNYAENGLGVPCTIQSSSSAELNLDPDDEIEKAFLYWAGSGERKSVV